MSLPSKGIVRVQFCLLVVSIAFVLPCLSSPATLDPVLSVRFLAWSIVLLLFSGSFLAQVLLKQECIDHTVVRRGVFVAFLGYLLSSLASLVGAVNLPEGAYEVLKVFMSAFFLLAAVIVISRSPRYTLTLAKAVVLSASILSFVGFYQYLRYGAAEVPGRSLMTGTMGHKNLFASALFLMLPFCAYVVLMCRSRWRIAGTVAVASIIVLIVSSETRTTLLALIVATSLTAMVVAKLMHSDRLRIPRETRGPLIRKVCAFGIFLLILGLPVGYRYLQVHPATDAVESVFNPESLSLRISTWQKTLEMTRDAPILGVGPGNWKIVFPSYQVPSGLSAEWLRERFFVRPHNDFLWVLSESGVVGFVFYLLILLIPIVYVFRMLFGRPAYHDTPLLLSMLYGIVGYVVIAFFSFPKERVFHSVFFLTMVAIVTSVYHKEYAPKRKTTPLPLIAFLLLAQAVLPFATVVAGFRINAEVHTKRALAARAIQDWSAVISEVNKGYSAFAAVDPMSTPLLWYSGEAHFMRGEISHAREDYREALEVNPNHILALSNLATCYELDGRHAEAIQYYERALAIHTRFSEALANLVAVYFNEGRYEEARDVLLQHDPNTEDPTLERYLRILDAKVERAIAPRKAVGESELETKEAASYARDGAKGVHQLWSSTYGRCFYTIDEREKDVLTGQVSGLWTDEGIVFYAFTENRLADLRPVYRFHCPELNSHFYTIATAEAEKLREDNAQQWQYKGIAFYAYPEGQQPSNTTPVYRFWSDRLRYHYYTTSEDERNKLRATYSQNWTYEGIAWYAY